MVISHSILIDLLPPYLCLDIINSLEILPTLIGQLIY